MVKKTPTKNNLFISIFHTCLNIKYLHIWKEKVTKTIVYVPPKINEIPDTFLKSKRNQRNLFL